MKVLVQDVADINKHNFDYQGVHIINYLDTGSITKNEIVQYQTINTKINKVPSRAKRKVEIGTIVYSSVRPKLCHYGILEDVPQNCVVSTGFITLDVKENKIDPYYLYYIISSNDKTEKLAQLADTAVTAYPSIRPSDMANLEIEIVEDIEEQKKIAIILKKIDDKIANNNKINLELEQIAKTIYDYWFLQFEFPNENNKPYKSSGGKMVWNEELKKEIPEKWSSSILEKITICHDSKRIPISKMKRKQRKGTIPYYGATGVTDYVNDFILDGDYILMAEDGSIMDKQGHPILQRIRGKCWVNNHAHILEPTNRYSCKLVMMMLKNIPVVKIKTGSIQMKINQENLRNIKILDIPDPIKSKINRKLNIIDKKILQLQKENEELIKLRDYLLPLLIKGQVGFQKIS